MLIRSTAIAVLAASMAHGSEPGFNPSTCTFNGKRLYGDIKVVTTFPDVKVKVVTAFPDIRVKKVSAFPDSCGTWRFVTSFPDTTVQFVDTFPDIEIQYVDSFPGIP